MARFSPFTSSESYDTAKASVADFCATEAGSMFFGAISLVNFFWGVSTASDRTGSSLAISAMAIKLFGEHQMFQKPLMKNGILMLTKVG